MNPFIRKYLYSRAYYKRLVLRNKLILTSNIAKTATKFLKNHQHGNY